MAIRDELHRELAANGMKAALRFIAHNTDTTLSGARLLLSTQIDVDLNSIHHRESVGIHKIYIPEMLRILNTIRPIWSRYQLDPRDREIDIWMRIFADRAK